MASAVFCAQILLHIQLLVPEPLQQSVVVQLVLQTQGQGTHWVLQQELLCYPQYTYAEQQTGLTQAKQHLTQQP